jgi:hypothetical protein
MKGNRSGAIGSLLFAILFGVIGVFAYANDYYLLLFRVIPLNAAAFGIIAALLLVYAIYQLATAGKRDQEIEATIQQQAVAASQAAAANTIAPDQGLTPLGLPCTVNIVHTKGTLGMVNVLSVALNGFNIGQLKNKQTLSVTTTVAENALTVVNSAAPNNPATITFMAVSGGVVNLSIKLSLTGGGVLTLEQV